MNRAKKIHRKIVAGWFLLLSLSGCTESLSLNSAITESPEIKILSLSKEAREVVLSSSASLDLSNYILRQGETKNFYSLTGNYLQAGKSLVIHLPSSFFRKGKNEINLYRLKKVFSLEEI